MNTRATLSAVVLSAALVSGVFAARWLLSGESLTHVAAGGTAVTGAASNAAVTGACLDPDHAAVITRAAAAPGNGAGADPGAEAPPGMVWVSGGAFTMGSDASYPEEAPASPRTVDGFWIDRFEVTNAEFAQFVATTGYVTLAERGVRTANTADAPQVRGSAVFTPRDGGPAMTSVPYWWRFVEGASWRAPSGPGSSIEDMPHYPVVHVAYEDAVAYADWKGHRLPTEVEFEFAAQGSSHLDATGQHAANTWQGTFPTVDTAADGFAGLAPVGCYEPNPVGAYDLLGNVWEWTASPYYHRHDFDNRAAFPNGFDPTQPDEPAVAVIKGGSFLCSPDYCARYRPEARIGQSIGLGASHIGFRTILQP